MFKINFKAEDMTLSQAINCAMDISTRYYGSPIMFEFNGLAFSVTAPRGGMFAPTIVEPRMIKDFDDQVLCDEYFRRLKSSQDFRTIMDERNAIELRDVLNEIFADSKSRN